MTQKKRPLFYVMLGEGECAHPKAMLLGFRVNQIFREDVLALLNHLPHPKWLGHECMRERKDQLVTPPCSSRIAPTPFLEHSDLQVLLRPLICTVDDAVFNFVVLSFNLRFL